MTFDSYKKQKFAFLHQVMSSTLWRLAERLRSQKKSEGHLGFDKHHQEKNPGNSTNSIHTERLMTASCSTLIRFNLLFALRQQHECILEYIHCVCHQYPSWWKSERFRWLIWIWWSIKLKHKSYMAEAVRPNTQRHLIIYIYVWGRW